MEVAATFIKPVVLASNASSSVAEIEESVIAIAIALSVPVIPARVAMSPSEIVPVIAPVVLAFRAVNSDTEIPP